MDRTDDFAQALPRLQLVFGIRHAKLCGILVGDLIAVVDGCRGGLDDVAVRGGGESCCHGTGVRGELCLMQGGSAGRVEIV